MAIHPDLPGIEITISVAGQALPEYHCDNEPLPKQMPNSRSKDFKKLMHRQKCTISKYIEAVTGHAFIVNIDVHEPYVLNAPKLQFRTFVDGIWIREPIMSQEDYKSGKWTDEVEGPVSDIKSGHRTMSFDEVEKGKYITSIPNVNICL